MELVYPHLNGVHGTFAIGPSHVLFVGMGGKIVDEPESTRLEGERLRYPAWEVEYRLKTIGELKDYEKVFLFATQPAHKGLHAAGSETLAELINTYRPQLAVVALRFDPGSGSAACPPDVRACTESCADR